MTHDDRRSAGLFTVMIYMLGGAPARPRKGAERDPARTCGCLASVAECCIAACLLLHPTHSRLLTASLQQFVQLKDSLSRNTCQSTLFRSSKSGPPIYVRSGSRTFVRDDRDALSRKPTGPRCTQVRPDLIFGRAAAQEQTLVVTPNLFTFRPFNAASVSNSSLRSGATPRGPRTRTHRTPPPYGPKSVGVAHAVPQSICARPRDGSSVDAEPQYIGSTASSPIRRASNGLLGRRGAGAPQCGARGQAGPPGAFAVCVIRCGDPWPWRGVLARTPKTPKTNLLFY
ncbi:hypothetical protein GGX14DRAFT_404789 [Mycena pura]|uniref:Uncharacterized protein n=1 Tax=Mycena pura TaxID=153505 RepID=A0AAD6UTS5_9AGAR|nr:hypothetical protein GGX14DRAFT_404789 [Mycena pura]